MNGGLSAEPRPRLGHWRRLPCESNGHDAKNLANAMPPRDSASTRDAFQVTSESTNRRVLAAAPSRPVGMWTARTKRAPETSRSWPPSSCAAERLTLAPALRRLLGTSGRSVRVLGLFALATTFTIAWQNQPNQRTNRTRQPGGGLGEGGQRLPQRVRRSGPL